jgi:CheY-like chemotaxis protein
MGPQRRALGPLHGLTVLVVEDHDASREAIRELIFAAGGHPLTAAHGGPALRLLETVHPDVILCDLKMPGMDGWKFARRVRSDGRYRGLPIIAVTGLDRDADFLGTLEAGFDHHLIKPLDMETLTAVIRRFAGARRLRRRPKRRPDWPRSA